MNDTFKIKKLVWTVLLSSSVLNNTKYKAEFKVCNKMLNGQNKQQQQNNVRIYKEGFKLT